MFPIATFGVLYEMIQTHDELESMQIYAHKRQVNLLNDQDLSIMNIVFYSEERRATVFHCDTPGHCNYDKPYDYSFDDNIMLACSYVISSHYKL